MTDLEESSLVKGLKGDLSRILKGLRVRDIPADKKRDAANKVIELFALLGVEQDEGDKKLVAEILKLK